MPSISDKTEIGLPIKNLLGLIAGTAVAVWAYFGIIERLNGGIASRPTTGYAHRIYGNTIGSYAKRYGKYDVKYRKHKKSSTRY